MARGYQRGPHLYRRGDRWYARGGELKRAGVSLGTSDHAEAQRRFRDLLQGKHPSGADGRRAKGGAPSEAALTELARAWLDAPHGYTARTLRTHENRLLAVIGWLEAHGVTLPSQLTPQKLDAWIAERSKAVSRVTINRDLRVLRVCLAWGESRGMCKASVTRERKSLREPKRHRVHMVPSPKEMAKILRAMKPYPRARAACTALWLTGLRVEELRHLTDASLVDGALRVEPEAGAAAEAWESKGYRTRTIPLAPLAQKAVRDYLAVAPGPRGKPITERNLLTRLSAACESAGVPRCTVHDLRRAFATEASRAGVVITVIARWLGHAAVATTERYIAHYRGDAEVAAPVPATAESLLKVGGKSGRRGAERPRSAPRKKR